MIEKNKKRFVKKKYKNFLRFQQNTEIKKTNKKTKKAENPPKKKTRLFIKPLPPTDV